ncbi:MAG: TetR/AcrR family transcriptional regulator [Alphaproteobacteria bacterium]|nr:TetR/AcrR family transcriptional regulator [Alphaproteobacteria bacterium]
MPDSYGPADYPTISRRERKKRDTRRRILEAAMQLMADTPYDQVRIEDICVAADVANATFFLHFSNKSALVLAFNEEVAGKIVEQLALIEAQAAERLKKLLQIYLAEWGTHSHLMRQIVLEFLSQPASGASFNEVSPGLLGVVASIIRDGQKSEEFSNRITPETAGLALVAAWNAIAISWAKTGDTSHASEAHRQTLDVFLEGLLARK